jgi:hypothetical protein
MRQDIAQLMLMNETGMQTIGVTIGKPEGASILCILPIFVKREKEPVKVEVRLQRVHKDGGAAIIFSFAIGMASRKVCIGVLPKHQRP